MRQRRQVDPQGEAVAERRGKPLLFGEALVQRQHAEAARQRQTQPVALHRHRAGIEHGGDAGRRPDLEALGHRDHDDPAIGLRQQPALADGASR